MAKRSSQGIRNLQSAGRTAAKITGRASEKSAVGFARWATTDHLEIGRNLKNMPTLGIFNTLKIVLVKLLIGVIGAVLSVAWIMVLIGYGIPLFITGHF